MVSLNDKVKEKALEKGRKDFPEMSDVIRDMKENEVQILLQTMVQTLTDLENRVIILEK